MKFRLGESTSRSSDAAVDKIATARWENEGGRIDENKEKKMSCCSDVMKPIEASSCCTPKDTAVHAAQAMRKSGCGCAPIVENTETRKLVGVVTERDVCCGVIPGNGCREGVAR